MPDATYVPDGAGQSIERLMQRIEELEEQDRQNRHSLRLYARREQQWVQALSAGREGLCLLDDRSVISFANPALAHLLGYSAKQMAGWRVYDLFADRLKPRAREVLERIAQGATEQREFELLHCDGSSVPVSLIFLPMMNGSGQPLGVIMLAQDLSDKVTRAQALHIQQELIREMESSAKIGAFSYEISTRQFTATAGVYAVHGLDEQSPDALQAALARYDSTSRILIEWAAHRVLEKGQPVDLELTYKGADGEARDLRLVGSAERSGDRVTRLLGSIQDVTAVARVKEASRSSSIRYQTVLHRNPNPVLTFDIQGRLVDANEAALQFLECTAKDLGEKGYQDLGEWDALGCGDAVSWEQIVRHGGVVHLTSEAARQSRRLELTMTPVRLLNETLVVAVGRDISTEYALQSHLLRVQRLEALASLAGGIAHGLTNVLTMIDTCCELADGSLASNDEMTILWDDVSRAGDRASALVQQLMAFGRCKVLESQPVAIDELVRGLSGMLGSIIGEHIVMQMTLDAADLTVELDRARMEEVLMTLAMHAAQSMSEGGSLSISTERYYPQPSGVTVSDLASGIQVVVRVSDTGPGHSEAECEHLFEPFAKLASGDTGLALAAAHGIVLQSGGLIDVSSEVGYGTTISLIFPASRSAGVRAEGSDAEPRDPSGRRTILIVEDEDSLRHMISRYLESAGYRVFEATDGEHALHLIAEHQGKVDLCLTDVVMPRLGGVQFIRALEQDQEHMRVLYMTGYPRHEFDTFGLDPTNVELIEKPFKAKDLEQRVRNLIGGGHPDREL